ncbi:MAG: rhodoquinone biosynthesis methyltransferase RquA [Rhodospirillales bacterium]|nr:rhodoquinone biosynthesis methyltransferase RquA [Rhodospirillales bacterium]
MDGGIEATFVEEANSQAPSLPDYLVRTYWWAYLTPASLLLLDNPVAMTAILWGNLPRLVRAACEEFEAGERVLQAACAYGNLSPQLAAQVGANGRLDIIDIAPLQAAHVRRKLQAFPQAHVRVADATIPAGRIYDGVCCFFLLHEIPDAEKRAAVSALLGAVDVGSKVVFVDYHRSHPWHPLRGPMSLVFRWLEPFANGLIETEIASFAANPDEFSWSKETFFGGLYQKVVAVRVAPPAGRSHRS